MAQCLRLICFLTIVVLVFVDIYCTFRYVSVNFGSWYIAFLCNSYASKFWSTRKYSPSSTWTVWFLSEVLTFWTPDYFWVPFEPNLRPFITVGNESDEHRQIASPFYSNFLTYKNDLTFYSAVWTRFVPMNQESLIHDIKWISRSSRVLIQGDSGS